VGFFYLYWDLGSERKTFFFIYKRDSIVLGLAVR
jgi:hypothetical protein